MVETILGSVFGVTLATTDVVAAGLMILNTLITFVLTLSVSTPVLGTSFCLVYTESGDAILLDDFGILLVSAVLGTAVFRTVALMVVFSLALSLLRTSTLPPLATMVAAEPVMELSVVVLVLATLLAVRTFVPVDKLAPHVTKLVVEHAVLTADVTRGGVAMDAVTHAVPLGTLFVLVTSTFLVVISTLFGRALTLSVVTLASSDLVVAVVVSALFVNTTSLWFVLEP